MKTRIFGCETIRRHLAVVDRDERMMLVSGFDVYPHLERLVVPLRGIVTWYGGFVGLKRGEQETEGRSNCQFVAVDDNIAVTAMKVHTCGTPRLAVS